MMYISQPEVDRIWSVSAWSKSAIEIRRLLSASNGDGEQGPVMQSRSRFNVTFRLRNLSISFVTAFSISVWWYLIVYSSWPGRARSHSAIETRVQRIYIIRLLCLKAPCQYLVFRNIHTASEIGWLTRKPHNPMLLDGYCGVNMSIKSLKLGHGCAVGPYPNDR